MEAINLVSRRTALSSLPFINTALFGCASGSPKYSLSSLPNKTVAIQALGWDPLLKLEPSDSVFAIPISQNGIRAEQAEINSFLAQWRPMVIGRFSQALGNYLQNRAIAIEHVPWDYFSYADKSKYAAFISSHLTAGFVYKTLFSTNYAPFVEVQLRAQLPNGTAIYRRMYAATDRIISLFSNRVPASTQYTFDDISKLGSESEKAIAALSTLAEQLAQKFALELTSEQA